MKGIIIWLTILTMLVGYVYYVGISCYYDLKGLAEIPFGQRHSQEESGDWGR